MYVIHLSKVVMSPDGYLTTIIGPFDSIHAATKWSWKKKNLWAAVPGTIESIVIVKGQYDE